MSIDHSQRSKRLTLPVLAAALAVQSGGQLVCYEGFEDYGAGDQVESGPNGSGGTPLDGGTGWGGAYNVSDHIKTLVKIEDRSSSPVDYVSGDIVLPGGNRALRFYDIANGSYAVRRPLGRVFAATVDESLWFSVLFRTGPGGNSPLEEQDFFQIGFDRMGNPPSGNPRVSMGSNTISNTGFPAAYHFFARSTTTVASSSFDDRLPIAAGTTYLLVCQIRPTAGIYDTVHLFVNPSSLAAPGSPSATITTPSGLSTLSHAFIRTSFLENGDAYVLDEWRIGRDYGSVVGSLQNALEILPASVPGGSPTLRWPASLPGVILESSTTLAPASWEVASEPFTASAGGMFCPVPIGPGTPRRFYRLRR